MTNILPYSFIPGTKARAQEVNANFQTVMQSIDETAENSKDYTDEKIQEAIESQTQENDGKFVNFNQVTNIILSAPNRIAELNSENTNIIVKEGLSVLIPNGKNSDGTLKNIKYTVENDITMSRRIAYSGTLHFFLTKNGVVYDAAAYFTINSAAGADKKLSMYYVTEENKHYYVNSSGVAEEIEVVYLGRFYNPDSTITSVLSELVPVECASILTRNNIEELASYGVPGTKRYNNSAPASGKTITARYNGWFSFERTSSSAGQVLGLRNSTTQMGSTVYATGPSQYWKVHIPVKKFDVVTVEHTFPSGGHLWFIYNTGEN